MSIFIKNGEVVNAGFETGDFTGYTFDPIYPPTVSSAQAHSGIYSALLDYPFASDEWLRQDLINIPVDTLTAFGFWSYGEWHGCFGGSRLSITVTYTDATTTVFINTTAQADADTWVYVDILVQLTAGKIIDAVEFSSAGSLYTYIDDISYVGFEIISIGWAESQISDVAIRSVPLRTSGAKVDTSTYTIKPRKLDIEIRLTDAEKVLVEDVFNVNTEVTITATNDAGTWTYYGWFSRKPLFYQYAHQNDGTREWRTTLSFTIYSFNFV